jgi:2,3-diaminopropionate biosynthesis protein SbnB
MLIVRHADVAELLVGREHDVLEAVRLAYLRHDRGESALPHSTFLRFPGNGQAGNRIIGLPAYLGGDGGVAGVKWIASFPGNLALSVDRASAVIVLNSVETGRPEALIEGSLISAARTAASAAIAADRLLPPEPSGDRGVTLIGCGVINLAILQYLAAARTDLAEVVLYDRVTDRASAFARRCERVVPGLAVTVTDLERAIKSHQLISIATTATRPHLDGLPAGATVLHISLRDLTPETILGAHNVTDDADHACREGTSLQLAQQLTGDRAFIDASLGDLLRTNRRLSRDPGKAAIFSPFGLGVLDLAVARLVRDDAVRQGRGIRVDGFLPDGSPLSGDG